MERLFPSLATFRDVVHDRFSHDFPVYMIRLTCGTQQVVHDLKSSRLLWTDLYANDSCDCVHTGTELVMVPSVSAPETNQPTNQVHEYVCTGTYMHKINKQTGTENKPLLFRPS